MAWKPMEFWRPIATAPRDGTEIFVYRRIEPWSIYGIARWEQCHGIEGWLSRALFDPPGVLGLGNPTHWRPLFTPPDDVLANPDRDAVAAWDAEKIHSLILERNKAREQLAAIGAVLNDPDYDPRGGNR